MVRELEKVHQTEFPETAPTANPVFYRTYSRKTETGRETWTEVCDRTINGLRKLGQLTPEETDLLYRMQSQLKALSSGRWLWVGGTEWISQQQNFSGAYNCSSTNIVDWHSFGLLMDLAMMGCGTGAVLEPHNIEQLPPIRNHLNIVLRGEIGASPAELRRELTEVKFHQDGAEIFVGDSRQGWVGSYQALLELSTDERFSGKVNVIIDLNDVRAAGEPLKGFGGVANPVKLPELYQRCGNILNQAVGRQLNSVECCLLIDEAAVTIVAGNIRRSAGMRQGNSSDRLFAVAKDNLWRQDENGNWGIDPKRDALRMANHTHVFHHKPTLEECVEAVRKQFYSGEGAIQWAGEAVARANCDLLRTLEIKRDFLKAYGEDNAKKWFQEHYPNISNDELEHRLARVGLNPCGEIIGSNFHCNLSEIHLNQIDPNNHKEQEEAFTAGALSVATLLNHKFLEPRYNSSRELDPIVGVSFTGLFDFFVKAFGIEWLHWWQTGRPATIQGLEFKEQEAKYLSRWRQIVHRVVWDYCDRHNLKRPNRCTTVQPSGCLDKTALRIFDQGLLYADEVVAPGSGETVGLELTVRNGIGASTAIANQPLKLVELKLANGRTLRMTPNHRMSVAGKWVYACELKPGMLLDYSIGEYQKQEDALLIPLQLEDYTRVKRSQALGHNRGVLTQEIVTPATMTSDLAYFLGCLFGNGCISKHKYRVRFSHGRLDVLHRLQETGKKLFGIEGNINDLGNGRFELSFASRQLFDWLHLNQLAKTEKSKDLDRIPLSLRRSSRVTLLSFFCGLIDTDGCVRKEGSLSIDSASSDFIRNLQQVGEAIGLCFSIFQNTKGENLQPQQKDMWGLCLSRMLSNPDALDYLNEYSIKCQERPLFPPKRVFSFSPYKIESVNIGAVCDYSYDFAIEGIDDNDSWYWQGGLKSHNTKSLLTNAAPGWHPPFGLRWVRRITFAKNDPVALACLDYGYSVIPGQSSKDENGNLLNDPFDDRAKEWLVEIPVQVSWIDLPGVEEIAIEKFSATAMFDFYMVVQQAWTTHNSSSTILLTEAEIEPLGKRIYEAIRDDEGYISSALLARFDAPFPRLPFERISKEEYEKLQREVLERRKSDDFSELMNGYVLASELPEMGPQDPACSGMVCELNASEPQVN